MSEELGKELAIEAAKAVAVEGYKDTLQPTLKAVGSVIALPFQAIDAALSKPKLWVAEKHYNYERTRQLLAEKLQDTPEELIVSPENYVAVPALQQIAYCFDSDELRDMYANLLANSMNKVVKNGVHPSFVEIIKQLCPDEAKLLNHLYANERIPTISFDVYKHTGGFTTLVKGFTNATEFCNCENPDEYEKYIDNLVRLGLLRRSNKERLTDDDLYEQLNTHPFIIGLKKQIEANEELNSKVKRIELSKGFIELTSFGKGFCSICLNIKKAVHIEIKRKENDDDQL